MKNQSEKISKNDSKKRKPNSTWNKTLIEYEALRGVVTLKVVFEKWKIQQTYGEN